MNSAELRIVGEIEHYSGEDLYFLVNGGADLFLEYGFSQVWAGNMSFQQNRSFRFEIYEMNSDSAAYGIFSIRRSCLKVARENKFLYAGEDDFLHIYIDKFYILLTGLNQLPVKDLLGVLDISVPKTASRFIPSTDQNGTYSTLVWGPIALSNLIFHGRILPGTFLSGRAYCRETATELVLTFQNERESIESWEKFQENYSKHSRFPESESGQNWMNLKDTREKSLRLQFQGVNWLILEDL